MIKMSVLRHPVVLTSLEEDFQKIGLLKERKSEENENFDEEYQEGYRERTVGTKDLPRGQGGETGTGSPGKHRRREGSAAQMKMGYQTGGDELNRQSGAHKDPSIDYGTTEDDDDDGDGQMSEAAQFAESFNAEWEAMVKAGVEEITLDEDDMAELEDLGEEIVELDPPVSEDDDDSDEDDDIDEDDDLDEAGYGKKMKGGKKKGGKYAGAYEDIAKAMSAIEGIVEQNSGLPSAQEATPAFANIALIAEMLAGHFNRAGELAEDRDLVEAAQTFAEMAKYAAGVVEFLQTEDESGIDFKAVHESFSETMETVLQGLEVYQGLTENEEDLATLEDDDEDDEGNE
jgi:hypothetical protein